MRITAALELRRAIRNPYVWPGGYPTFIFTDNGESYCRECARENMREILENGAGVDVNWECESLYCGCGAQIEYAYPSEEG